LPNDPHTFWGSNYYKHPPLTDDAIAFAERALGVSLPAEFVTLLRAQNGGYTRGFAHPMGRRTSWADDHVPLNDLAGIVTDPSHRTALNLLDTEYLTAEWNLPPKQVLLSGDGHWWLTLDYRNGPTPSVAWIDVDSGEDIQVSESFASFLRALIPSSTYDET
jgi:hypothetical protein